MDVRAAVAEAAGEPLKVETVQLDGPKDDEILVEIKSTGICHADDRVCAEYGAELDLSPESCMPVATEGSG